VSEYDRIRVAAAGYRGLVGPAVPSVVVEGRRIRAVGRFGYRRPEGEPFHVFLIGLLRWKLNEQWFQRQLHLPEALRHPIVTWYVAWETLARSHAPAPLPTMMTIQPDGFSQALLTLGHDLYTLLSARVDARSLLRRLRHRDHFQGARYELAVAAMVLRAGCQITLLDDRQDVHPEFVGVDTVTGARFAVEAKSRHRPGILSRPGVNDPERALGDDLHRLLDDCLHHDPGVDGFVGFLDVNAPPLAGETLHARPWIRGVLAAAAARERKGDAAYSAIVATNFSYYWDEDRPARGAEYTLRLGSTPRCPLPTDLLARLFAVIRDYSYPPMSL
jgi:hypothetical protein